MTGTGRSSERGSWLVVVVAWALVGIPLAWGVYRTLQTAVKLFR
jgi:hypothetical protein